MTDHGPVHPHPIANELTDDPTLVKAPPDQPPVDDLSMGRGGRRLLKLGAVALGVALLAGLVVGFVGFRDRPELLLAGALALAIYGIVLAAPTLLAGGTKVVQDEAVRESAETPPRP